MVDGIPFGRRLTALALERPGDTALVFGAADGTDQRFTWAQLDARANQAARLLAGSGAGPGDVVAVGLPNSPENVSTTFGAWKLGASVLPLRPNLPAWERDRMLGVATPRVLVGDWADALPGMLTTGDVRASAALEATPFGGDHVPPHSRMVATSGSTGTPKIIVTPAPGLYVDGGGAGPALVLPHSVVMAASPLYHTNGFSFCFPPLLQGNTVVLMEHFDAARAVELIERHRVTMTVLVPTMLQRIARLPDVRERDLSSLERVVYGGAVLPEWAARIWLELIPPENFLLTYGGTEGLGFVMCTGREWLDHPGTTGRPADCDAVILGPDHEELPVGEVGEIWLRLHSPDQPFRYLGVDTPEPIQGGYRTFGDMGRLDEEGYVYISDRRQDMIVTGGVNVFPAEVEAAVSEHPGVADVVVVGLPDPEWGRRVHAIVQPRDPAAPPTQDELRTWCKERLSGPKVPKEFEFLEELPRTSAGKINRSRLVQERSESDAAAPVT